MCWNKNVSLITFIIAILGCVYLYKRNRPNDRWIAVFGVTIAMIQLAEFFMWGDPSCGAINKYASMFAMLILGLEPLMNMIGGIYFSDTPDKKVLKWVLFSYVVFIALLFFTQIYGKKILWCGTSVCVPDKNPLKGFVSDKTCNLTWYFMKNMKSSMGIIWILFLLIPFLTMKPQFKGILLFIFGLVTFFSAHYLNNAATGSLWCWLGITIIFYKIVSP